MHFATVSFLFIISVGLTTTESSSQKTTTTELDSFITSLKKRTKNVLEMVLTSLHRANAAGKNGINKILQRLNEARVNHQDVEEPATLDKSSCAQLFQQGNTKSGIYTIYPRFGEKSSIKVFCDMETDGGGWTVFQRRDKFDVEENFFRNWKDYEDGFGDLEKEFWLGNSMLYVLTNQDNVSLRIDLGDYQGNRTFAKYNKFYVNNRADNYRLTVGEFSGPAGDSMKSHDNRTFATFDRDNERNCAKLREGGWWYTYCYSANLNGKTNLGSFSEIAWLNWRKYDGFPNSLKKSEMKIRPKSFVHAENFNITQAE